MSLTQILAEIYDNIFKFNGADILILFDKNNESPLYVYVKF